MVIDSDKTLVQRFSTKGLKHQEAGERLLTPSPTANPILGGHHRLQESGKRAVPIIQPPKEMNRKDSKRKSRAEFSGQIPPNNGVCSAPKRRPGQSRRRRMTCPSPAEINKAMEAVSLPQFGNGCSLEELVEKCIQSFDVGGKLWRNEELVHMTLVMHSWVVPSTDFAQKLLQLYPYKEATESQRKDQICYLLRLWVTQYPEVFRLDSRLEEMMSDFWEVVKDRGESHRRLSDTPHVLDPEVTRKLPGSPSINKKRKVSLLFDHLEPSQLADHLSYLEFRCFCRISHLDYRSYTHQSSLWEIPRLERSVTLCNSISQWVQLMILNRPTPQQRAEVFTKFIQVTQKLRKLQNFNTLMAVIGGLCHSAISRLKETHSHLSQDVLKTLSEMTELLSSSSNYSTYRRVYNECGGFKIPILGVQLKDLVSLNEALPNYLDNGKINVSKLHSLYQHITELLQLQKAHPPFTADKDVILLLSSSLDLFHTEDEIYALSYAREPRSHKTLPPAPYKPTTDITQWTQDVPLSDPDTLSHNVDQMVESIFQFYDPDQRGFVSLGDFEKVVACFPFSCNILEKDREGQVSRQDMELYFRKASNVCNKLGVSFLQRLVETRLKKSPLCASCVWAVARQGYMGGGLEKESLHNWSPAPSNLPVDNIIPTGQGKTSTCQKATQTEGPLKGVGSAPHSVGGPAHPKTQCWNPRRTEKTLLDQLQEVEKENNRLLLENAGLHCSNSQLSAENARLQSQLYAMQEGMRALSLDSRTPASITQILETMGSLHIHCDGNL
ncbi:LOW QUALITY PROTEIN: RAS guanyl-releasing protein 4-like [Rhinophrynus dorsalis]